MSGIYGALGVSDTERVFLRTLGQQLVYDAVSQVVVDYNADLARVKSLFVQQATTDYKIRYKLQGGGRLQRLGGQAPSGATKVTGNWDVAFPLEDFGAAVASDRIDMAYMTVQDLNLHVEGVKTRNTNTERHEMLRALFNNAARTFEDRHYGSLTIQPLANGDAVNYPPVLGAETEATDNHFLTSGYAASAISDTNNPFPVIRDELEEHFGAPTGGSEIVAFINNAQTAKVGDLSELNKQYDRHVIPGANADTISGLPPIPGRIIGRTDSGVWVSEWRFIPAGYIMAVHLDAPAPLMQRTHPPETGLATALTLIAKDMEYPVETSSWENSFGFGVGNRLNGVAIELTADVSYDTPAAFV